MLVPVMLVPVMLESVMPVIRSTRRMRVVMTCVHIDH